VVEVPSFEAPRRSGESNLRTFRDGSRVLRELLSARRRELPFTATEPLPATRPRRFSRPAMQEPATVTASSDQGLGGQSLG
jgi:hypothetical protein